jgi:3-oxoacyl-[acyl-carrier-protein] synthase-3
MSTSFSSAPNHRITRCPPRLACFNLGWVLRPLRAALDFNLGCSGYVYGLSLAKGLIETGQARNLLLITAETYSKHIDPQDRTVRLIFGDAAATTLIQADPSTDAGIGPFVFGTDGTGAPNLIVRKGALRTNDPPDGPLDLYMNGQEIFAFTLNTIPKAVHRLLAVAGKSIAQIDLFIFHQANAYMLEHLRRRLEIPAEKFFFEVREIGNTVSASIPIAVKQAQELGRFKSGQLAMLVGFGVGYSWSATLVRLP